MPITIELPSRDSQLAFNQKRWAEVVADPEWADTPGKIETNRHGQILVMPPVSGRDSLRTRRIQNCLEKLLGGTALPECPISTSDGVRAADVGWYSSQRLQEVEGQIAFEKAAEVCVEVMSPSNTASEMLEKTKLYFEAGAQEVWICQPDGNMEFFLEVAPSEVATHSACCPDFPRSIA